MSGGEDLFGGRQQFAALALAFLGQEGVATGDEPFTGVVGMGELGQVTLVEEAELEGPSSPAKAAICGAADRSTTRGRRSRATR